MRAEPFGGDDSQQQSRSEFRNHLKAILQANHHIGEKIPPDSVAKEQVTRSMDATRELTLDDRMAMYASERIQEQRTWYAKKSGANKRASKTWTIIALVVYAVAIALALLRIAHPNWKYWPIEPMLIIASSIIGWTQVKKYNELASSYALTAHEISLTKSALTEVKSEAEFASFVNDAEQAFSREHTQWVARQQTA